MAVLGAVAGQERDTAAADVAEVHRAGGRPVGRVDLDLVDAVEEVVEPGAAEDPDLGALRHQLAFAALFVLEEELDDDEPDDELEASFDVEPFEAPVEPPDDAPSPTDAAVGRGAVAVEEPSLLLGGAGARALGGRARLSVL